MKGIFGGIVVLAFILYGLLFMGLGYLGIENAFGWGWAVLAVILAIVRFTIPISVGAFLYTYNVLGWHWFWAGAFAAPTLLFMFPAFLIALFEVMNDKRKGSNSD